MATPPMNPPDGLLGSSSSCLVGGCLDDGSSNSHALHHNNNHHNNNHHHHHQPFRIPQVPAIVNNNNNNVSGLLSSSGIRSHQSHHHPIEETEDTLTSEFHKLSMQEQARALDDLNHASGSIKLMKEDPAIVDKLLQDFEQEVGRSKSPIYEQALNQDRSYVEDPAFRLKFLRANLHNVKKATKQMLSFLRYKATYFGSDKLASDITLDDLTPEELKIMLSGVNHIQNGTDRNGRVILYSFGKLTPKKFNTESMIRVTYYIWFNILIPMHSVQKKGLLVVNYDLGEHQNTPSLKSMMQILDFMSCLPIRYTANHICLKQRAHQGIIRASLTKMLCGMSIKAFPKHAMERARVHYGSDTELQYKLANEYGIPLDTFPVCQNGNLRMGIINAWFYKHMEHMEGGIEEIICNNNKNDAGGGQEDDYDEDDDDDDGMRSSGAARANGGGAKDDPSAPNTVTDGIWETDVLLGRGRLVQYHPGNIRFREFLDDHIQDYQGLARNQRRKACSDLARELMNTEGTRFLKQTEASLWVVCDFEDAVDKVAQFYRTRRRRDNNNVNNNNNNRPPGG